MIHRDVTESLGPEAVHLTYTWMEVIVGSNRAVGLFGNYR